MSSPEEGQWFVDFGSGIIGVQPASFKSNSWKRKWKAHFGISLRACLRVWIDIRESSTFLQRQHLLMGLNFLQCYRTEDVACAVFKVSAKSYRKWVWIVIQSIAKLEYVKTCKS